MSNKVATPAMRAVVIVRNRLRMTMSERAEMPISLEEAEILTGAAESCWSHHGFQQMMNVAIRTENVDTWIKIADLLDKVPIQKRVVGVFQYFADNTPIGRDAKWGKHWVHRLMDELRAKEAPLQAIAA